MFSYNSTSHFEQQHKFYGWWLLPLLQKKFKESQDRMIENVTAQSEVKLQALKTEKETEIQELTKKYRELTDKLKREFNQKLKNQEVSASTEKPVFLSAGIPSNHPWF